MNATSGVAIKAPITPNAAVIASNITKVDTGCIFMVVERKRGKIKSPMISSSAIKNKATHKAVIGEIVNATNTGGTAII